MRMPIIEGLKKYSKENNTRFHMPGHKGRNSLINWGELIPQIDVTEVEGTDNLHKPMSIILESEEIAARVFGAKRTFYSVNGTTAGIYAAITASAKAGEKIAIQRNCHKSVYNALILGRIEPVYIYPYYSQRNNIVTGIDPEDIRTLLEGDNDIKAVVITYPSYYGICSDVKAIADIVHSYNKMLIVDEAHGSHLVFSNKLPMSALEAGADISIQSTHKTLPAFTQSSMVHVGSDRVDIEKLQAKLSVFQTTSPSYLLMASLDAARAYMEVEGMSKLDSLIENIKEQTSYLKEIKGIEIFEKSNIDSSFHDFDITKLLIRVNNIKGSSLDTILRDKYSIQLEMADYYFGLALMTVMDDKEDLKRLGDALEDLVRTEYREDKLKDIDVRYIKADTKITLYEASNIETEAIELKKSKGRISGDFITPYPPGIPVISPGEVITEEIIEYIQELRKCNIQILGFLDYNREKIKVVK